MSSSSLVVQMTTEQLKALIEQSVRAAMASAKTPVSEKAPRAKKEKDPNAPKKPLSGYMLFCDRTRKAAPTMTYTATQLGELWKALSDERKAEYKVAA